MSDKETQVCECGQSANVPKDELTEFCLCKCHSPIEKPIDTPIKNNILNIEQFPHGMTNRLGFRITATEKPIEWKVELSIEFAKEITKDWSIKQIADWWLKQINLREVSLISEIEKMRKVGPEYIGHWQSDGFNSALDSVIAKIKEKLDK